MKVEVENLEEELEVTRQLLRKRRPASRATPGSANRRSRRRPRDASHGDMDNTNNNDTITQNVDDQKTTERRTAEGIEITPDALAKMSSMSDLTSDNTTNVHTAKTLSQELSSQDKAELEQLGDAND